MLGRAAALGALALAASSSQALVSLGAYNVDPSQVSVSGLSSGAFMAQQLGVAYSSRFMGIGVFEGGIYDCWRTVPPPGCSYPNSPSIGQAVANMNAWSGSLIDPVSNIARQKVYVFVGTNDTKVGAAVTDQVVALYKLFAPAGNIRYDNTVPSGEALPTDSDGPGVHACADNGIANCNFDGTGAVLQWIYGTLKPRNSGALTGSLIQFDQSAYASPAIGMDTEGWMYVPADCAAGRSCRLHIALHGCGLNYAQVGTNFVSSTGYNRWADTNDIIVLYPQTSLDASQPANDIGCWDFHAGYGLNYDQHGGAQIEAIMAMVNRIVGGYVPNYGGLWWASPAGSESGWGINFAHQGDIIFASWFTYDAAGKGLWLVMIAPKAAPNTYSGTLYSTSGPPFNAEPFDPAQVKATAVGSGALNFTDSGTGTFAYLVNGVAQVKSITREVFGPLPLCTFGALPDLALARNAQDLWWADPPGSESGWGINLTHEGDTIFGTWFTYDLDGTPMWLVVTAQKSAAATYAGTLYRTTGPAFSAVPFSPANVVATAVGSATFTFSGGNAATFAYTVNGVSQVKNITREVFAGPGTTCR
ncbi:MAG TPA: PHB depolymerase family esterase [Burkholderiales bacterium]